MRSFRCQVLVAALLAAAWTALLSWAPGATGARTASNLGLLAAPVLATASCLLAARRNPASRRTWRLFAAASASWAVGQALWSWYEEVLGREAPFPSVADVGYLGMVPLAVAALLTVPGAPRDPSARARTVLEGLVIASSVLLLSWAFVLQPVSQSQELGPFSRAIALAYPLGDVAMATMAVSVLSRIRQARLPVATLGMLCGALVALAVSDSLFAMLVATGEYVSGSFADVGWFCGFLLLALAARRPVLAPLAPADVDLAPRGRVAAMTPYVTVVLLLAAMVGHQLVVGNVDRFLQWGLRSTLLLLVTSQYLAIRENHALARDLERRVADRTVELVAREERFRSLVQHSSDVVTIVDERGVVVYQSPSVLPVFGYDADVLVGTEVVDLVPPRERGRVAAVMAAVAAEPGGSDVVEVAVLHRDGTRRMSETTVTNLLHVASVRGIVLNTRDVSERRRLQVALTHQAYHDPLTGLPNRARFQERLDAALGRPEGHRDVALLFVDLDGFKTVNDSLGHGAGDEVLVRVARRLADCVRPADIVARLGGDEFAVLLDEVLTGSEATSVAERIVDALREPVAVAGQEVFVTASVGIAVGRPGDDTPDSLLNDADAAMYRAKASGLGGYERFEPTMRATTPDRVALESELHRALAQDELRLHYQPTIDLGSGRVVGLEALVRWQHPTQGLLSPAAFVPVAERSPLIVSLGRWVLREACRQAASWRRDLPGADDLFVAVNLSGRQVRHPDVTLDVADALAAAGLPAAGLVLEMTESVLIDHSDETLSTLQQLRELGTRLAVDDFGTGWSSLSYLHKFPVDVLKIDRTFVDRLTGEQGDGSLAAAIVRIGDALRLETVAEGVETPEQLEALRAMGCERAQGYLLGRPVPVEAVPALLLGGATPRGGADAWSLRTVATAALVATG